MQIKNLFQNQTFKNILSVICVPIFGFVLLIITLIYYLFLVGLSIFWLEIFTQNNLLTLMIMGNFWFAPIEHFLFVIGIGVISWFFLKTSLNKIYKAIFMNVPLAVIYSTIGLFLHQWEIVSFITAGLFTIALLYYFYKTKMPWLYYYTVILAPVVWAVFYFLITEY